MDVVPLDAEVHDAGVRAAARRLERAVDDRVGALASEVPHVICHPEGHMDGLIGANGFAADVRNAGALLRGATTGAVAPPSPRAECELLLLCHLVLPVNRRTEV
jgi:hypothetical protein